MTSSNKIEYLVGGKNYENKNMLPYNSKVLDLIIDFSKELNLNKKTEKYPDIKTLAFFCRKANIYKLKERFVSNETRLGLGLVFHITPSNIPTNFAYSLIFGLLTGNSNIVKVSSKKFEQIDLICDALNRVLKKKKHNLFKKLITIIRYSDHKEITKRISKICEARLIWGGDETIKNIRSFSLKERAIDIPFADRYSFCVIDAEKIEKLKAGELDRIVERFYNDTYTADQNACSSPHLLVWLGSKGHKGRTAFWNKLSKIVVKKYNPPQLAVMDKYTQLCTDIIRLKNMKKFNVFNNSIYTVLLKKLDNQIDSLRGKWGFFYEYQTSNLNNITKFINKKFQTLTYYGIDKKVLKKFVLENNLNGIDRIVPIGEALNVNLIWDGYDINKTLSRLVDIK